MFLDEKTLSISHQYTSILYYEANIFYFHSVHHVLSLFNCSLNISEAATNQIDCRCTQC